MRPPTSSPWGEVQSCTALYPGVWIVDTASHGGALIVAHRIGLIRSRCPALLKPSAFFELRADGSAWFEEDAEIARAVLGIPEVPEWGTLHAQSSAWRILAGTHKAIAAAYRAAHVDHVRTLELYLEERAAKSAKG